MIVRATTTMRQQPRMQPGRVFSVLRQFSFGQLPCLALRDPRDGKSFSAAAADFEVIA